MLNLMIKLAGMVRVHDWIFGSSGFHTADFLMRILGFLISIVFHAGLIALALTWSVSAPTKISLDMPVYKVELVSLAPSPVPAALKKSPAEPQKVVAKPESIEIPRKQPVSPKPAIKVEEAVKPKTAPMPKAKPKPEVKQISPKKVKTTHHLTKTDKTKPKAEPVKRVKTPAKKKVAKKKEPTGQDLLAGALSDLRKEVDKKEQAERDAVTRELADLRKGAQATAAAIEGDGTASATGLVQVYGQIVRQAVKKNWRYPVFGGQQKDLTAVVRISLKPDGTITGIKVVSSSGNPDFDDSVLSALKDTEILPDPPGNSIKNILVNFNLHDLDH